MFNSGTLPNRKHMADWRTVQKERKLNRKETTVIKSGPRWLNKTGKDLSINDLNWVLFATVYIAYVTVNKHSEVNLMSPSVQFLQSGLLIVKRSLKNPNFNGRLKTISQGFKPKFGAEFP